MLRPNHTLALVQLCECRRPRRDPDGRCFYCGKALTQPEVFDIPRRDTIGAAKEYVGPHRKRRGMKGKKQ